MKKWFGDKAFLQTALAVAIPLMLQQLISVSVNLVDNLMVGTLGDAAIGGVASINKYYMIATFTINGIAAAAAVFIAQYNGAKDTQKMRESFRVLLISAVTIMALFMFGALLFTQAILQYFTKDAQVIAYGVTYLKIALWSYLPNAIILSIYFSMRAVGEMKIPLRTGVISVFTNTMLNYILIFGHFGFPRLELRGAAIATLTARFLELFLILYQLKRRDFGFKTKLTHLFHISPQTWKDVLSKATPLMINEVLWSFGMATTFKFYATRGSEVMSGYSIATTVSDLFMTFFGGMAGATTVLVSTPLGANELDKARENGYQLFRFSITMSVLIGIVMFFASFLVPHLYTHASPATQRIAMQIIRIQSMMFWVYMASTICYFILRAGGDMKHTMIMDSGFMWTVFIPTVAILTYFTNFNYLQLYLAGQATDIIKMVFAYYILRKEHWVRNLTAEA